MFSLALTPVNNTAPLNRCVYVRKYIQCIIIVSLCNAQVITSCVFEMRDFQFRFRVYCYKRTRKTSSLFELDCVINKIVKRRLKRLIIYNNRQWQHTSRPWPHLPDSQFSSLESSSHPQFMSHLMFVVRPDLHQTQYMFFGSRFFGWKWHILTRKGCQLCYLVLTNSTAWWFQPYSCWNAGCLGQTLSSAHLSHFWGSSTGSWWWHLLWWRHTKVSIRTEENIFTASVESLNCFEIPFKFCRY